MKNLNIRAKFILLSILIILIVLFLGIMAHIKSQEILSNYDETVTMAQQQENLQRMVGEALQTGQALRNIHIDVSDTTAISNLGKAIITLNDLMNHLKKIDPNIHTKLNASYEPFYINTQELYVQAQHHQKLKREQIVQNTELWRAYKKVLKVQAAEMT